MIEGLNVEQRSSREVPGYVYATFCVTHTWLVAFAQKTLIVMCFHIRAIFEIRLVLKLHLLGLDLSHELSEAQLTSVSLMEVRLVNHDDLAS